MTIQFQSTPPSLVTLSGNNAVTVDSGTIDIASLPAVTISSGNISVTSGTISVSSLPDVTIANATLNVAGTVSIDTSGGAVPVTATGTVVVSNITDTVTISPAGTINVQGVSGGTAIGIAGSVTVESGTVDIGNTPSVTISNASIPVTGSVDANITNASITVKGSVDIGTVDSITAGSIEITNNSSTNIPPGSQVNYSMTMKAANTSYTAAPVRGLRTFFMIQNPSTETLSFGFGDMGNIFTLEPSQGYTEIVGTNPLITLAITVQGTIANQPVSIVTWE